MPLLAEVDLLMTKIKVKRTKLFITYIMFETPPQKPPEVKKEKSEVVSVIDYLTGTFVQIIEAITTPFGNKDKSE